MFKLNEIKELIEMIDQSSIEEFEIENEGTRLYISKPKQQQVAAAPVPVQHTPVQPAVPQAAGGNAGNANTPPSSAPSAGSAKEAEAPDRAGLHEIKSPMVGTFYAAPSPGAEPYVKKGDKVKEDTVVCIVEAMKLMNEIEAEVKGEIVEVLVENAELVEFGQPLFLVKPE